MSHINIAKKVFLALAKKLDNGSLPVELRPLSTTETVQDDPFDQNVKHTLQRLLNHQHHTFLQNRLIFK